MTGEKVMRLWQDLTGSQDEAEKERAFCDAALLLTHNPDEWERNRSDVMEKLQALAGKGCADALTAAGIILKGSREKTDRAAGLEMLEKAISLKLSVSAAKDEELNDYLELQGEIKEKIS